MSTLSELVVEVAALAHQLRKTDFRLQQKEGLLAPGRAVLQVLAEEGPRTVPWIAAKQNASRQNVQIIANRFAGQGLVEFRTNPAHKKSDLVQITEKGRQVLASSQSREGTILERLGEIDETQVHAAVELLRRMRQEIGGVQPEPKMPRIVSEGATNKPVSKPGPSALPTWHAEPQSSEFQEAMPVNLL